MNPDLLRLMKFIKTAVLSITIGFTLAGGVVVLLASTFNSGSPAAETMLWIGRYTTFAMIVVWITGMSCFVGMGLHIRTFASEVDEDSDDNDE